MTDFLKENIFGVPTDAGLSEILQANIWIIPAIIILVVVIVVGGRWLLRRLPPKDWSLSFEADSHQDEETGYTETETIKPLSGRFFDSRLIEKVVLISLVGIIFAQILPDVQASNLQLAVGVAFVIILNTVISHWLARHGTTFTSMVRQFIVMVVVNFGLILLYSLLINNLEGSLHLGNTLFFVLLLTLIVTLFDRYHQLYEARFIHPELAKPEAPAVEA